ncbi:unnamed protein product [Blepharisma stoltei]|uniref:Dynein regulatory complex protein 10 n=1 Tax=Blepharisma stoltei TaxID=1481888 RepID=A0AAU9IE43_9CILI|nr:unnamed protein product [Blepharisma stoltei]
MARPTHVDSQRIISLLEEMNQKLRILSWLSEENLEEVSYRQEELSSILDGDLVISLINHLRLMQAFNQYITKSDGRLIDIHDIDIENEIPEDAKTIGHHLEVSTSEVCRWLAKDPSSFEYLTKMISRTSSGTRNFSETTKDLQKLYLNKLMTPVEEEMNRERELQEIEEKLTKSKQEESSWNDKLTNLRRQREEGRENRNKEIQKLKAEIEKIKKETEDRINGINKTIQNRQKKSKQEYESKFTSLAQQFEQLTKEVDDLRAANKVKEDSLIGNKQKLMHRLGDNIKDYDRDMIDNQQQHEREEKTFNENKKALEMIEDHIRQLRMEKKRMEEEEAKEALKRKNFDALMSQKNTASEYISAHWKGYKSRLDYEKLKKSKKKRRGKKGK